MRTTLLYYVAAIAAAGSVLALAPVTGRAEQIQGGARGQAVLAQYCPPPQEDSDVPTLFCREQAERRMAEGT
jgi:hypothetical protein